MLVDSHCHINFEPLNEDEAGVIQRARDLGVEYMLCVSVNMEDYPEVLDLAHRHPFIFASVGVHPCYEDVEEPTGKDLIAVFTKFLEFMKAD